MNPGFVIPTGWSALLPELALTGLIGLILIGDVLLKEEAGKILSGIAVAGLAAVGFLVAAQWDQPARTVLAGMFRMDMLAVFFKGIFTIAALTTVLIARQTPALIRRGLGEFYLLILTATLGMFLTASAGNLLMLFVALEMITISFYVMVSYHQEERSLEAGLKYLVLGSIASGLFLYGLAFLFGTTGTADLTEMAAVIQGGLTESPMLVLGLFLVLSSILFKSACVPFQLWAPDVYQGAPTPAVAFLSVGSKAAGFVVALRLLIELLLPLGGVWIPVVVFLSGATILAGNLGAIPQSNIKRLFGYSTIGHGGYLLIGIAAGSFLGTQAILFYLAAYAFTNLAAFLVITAFSKTTGSDEIRDYAGLSRRSPFLAAMFFLALLSLAGVPPLAGFFGKFLLILSAVDAGHGVLAGIGAIAVVISLYYYLMIVKTMYADEPADPSPVPVPTTLRIMLWICAAGMLGLGLIQKPLVNWAAAAAQTLF